MESQHLWSDNTFLTRSEQFEVAKLKYRSGPMGIEAVHVSQSAVLSNFTRHSLGTRLHWLLASVYGEERNGRSKLRITKPSIEPGAEVYPLPKPRHFVGSPRPQAPVPLQGLFL